MKSQNKYNLPANSNGQSKTVTYKFVTGETSVVEVSGEIAAFLAECDRAEASRERMERRHCLSLDAAEYEGTDYSDGTTPETMIFAAIESENKSALIQNAISTLTKIQKRRLLMLVSGMKYEEIARLEGVTLTAVESSIAQSRKKLKKFS